MDESDLTILHKGAQTLDMRAKFQAEANWHIGFMCCKTQGLQPTGKCSLNFIVWNRNRSPLLPTLNSIFYNFNNNKKAHFEDVLLIVLVQTNHEKLKRNQKLYSKVGDTQEENKDKL